MSFPGYGTSAPAIAALTGSEGLVSDLPGAAGTSREGLTGSYGVGRGRDRRAPGLLRARPSALRTLPALSPEPEDVQGLSWLLEARGGLPAAEFSGDLALRIRLEVLELGRDGPASSLIARRAGGRELP